MLRITITDPRTSQTRTHLHQAGAIEFGRGPKQGNVERCVIDGDFISRNHMRIEELAGGKIQVHNLSTTNPIRLHDQIFIPPGGPARELKLPGRLRLGSLTIHIEEDRPINDVPIESLRTLAAPAIRRSQGTSGMTLMSLGSSPPPEVLAEWFEQIIRVQRAAAGSPEFYRETARALVEVVGLDRGLVLLRRGESWECVARVAAHDDGGRDAFSSTILRRVLELRYTVYQNTPTATGADSLTEVEAVVASPIFDSTEQIVGVVYGSRNRITGMTGGGIGSLEAQVVQLLASAVEAGLARQAQEQQALTLRSQFDQFFSPRLSAELQRNPRLLEGQEREVTVLFSDLRGFSRLAEKLGPRDACRLVREAMDRFTSRVREFDGVVVDFAGDGMMAMWNAPTDQPEHAVLACRAALAMIGDLPQVSESYRGVMGGALGLGIGINTGQALVGNVGSQTRLKYGPFGHTVNLASRVEGATKHLGVPLLVTGSTRERLGSDFSLRRLCRARLAGIDGAVDLFELHAARRDPAWDERRDTYEKALAQYEAMQWSSACQTVQSLLGLQEGHYDLPSLDLVSRAVECLRSPPEKFDPVFEFRSK
jgi:adenylate cyclase